MYSIEVSLHGSDYPDEAVVVCDGLHTVACHPQSTTIRPSALPASASHVVSIRMTAVSITPILKKQPSIDEVCPRLFGR